MSTCTTSSRPIPVRDRVQQVMLDNLTAASRALNGRIYDLLDATVDRAGLQFRGRHGRRPESIRTPSRACWPPSRHRNHVVARAKEIVADEDQLRTPVNIRRGDAAACRRPAAGDQPGDRLRLRRPGGARGGLDSLDRADIRHTHPPLRQSALPQAFGGGREALIAADAAAVAKTRQEQFRRAGDVVVLGPTEEAFQELVQACHADAARATCSPGPRRSTLRRSPGMRYSYTLLTLNITTESAVSGGPCRS